MYINIGQAVGRNGRQIMWYRSLVVLVLLLVVNLRVPCGAADIPDAEELLGNALEYTCNDAVFQCDKILWDGKVISQSRLLGFRGRLRLEKVAPYGLQFKLMPANQRGGFFVWVEVDGKIPGNTVIEAAPTEIIDYFAFLRAQLAPKRFDAGEYRIRDLGDSWRIEATYPSSDEYIMHTSTQNFAFYLVPPDLQMREDFLIEDLTPEQFHAGAESLRRGYYSTVIFFISKSPDNPLIFAYKANSISGKNLRAFQMKNVKFPVVLDESLFSPPSGTSTVTVHSADEFNRAWDEAGYPSTSGKDDGETAAQNGEISIRDYMGYIIIAAVVIILLLAAKIIFACIGRSR